LCIGLYRISVDVGETYLLVMRNIFGGKYSIHKKYDLKVSNYFTLIKILKGSTVQRQASEKEKSKQLPTLKDNDFLEENYKLMLPADAKAQLMKLLKADTSMFRHQKYYLLFRIFNKNASYGLFFVAWHS
jgi:1-phosphatidylinositol-5-phosphate 4-kinase